MTTGARPGIHVEMLGVPGAGKTALAPTVARAVRAAGYRPLTIDEAVVEAVRRGMADRVLDRFSAFVPRSLTLHLVNRSQDRLLALRDFLLENPRLLPVVLDALGTPRGEEDRPDLVLIWILELLWKFQLARREIVRSPSTALVVEEGFCNRAVSLFGYGFSARDEAALRAYLEAIPTPDLVVELQVDGATAVPRVTGRRRYRHLGEAGLVAYTEQAGRCAVRTGELLEERGITVLRVHTGGPFEPTRRAVAAEVEEWADGRR